MTTRRVFLAGLVGLSAGAGRAEPRQVLPPVVDAAFDLRTQNGLLAELKRRRVHTVFRYYAHQNQPERGLPTKVLTRAEAEALWDSGFSIGAVFQYNNDQISAMSTGRGMSDARHALDYAQSAIGQPFGSAIYFGVDGSWTTGRELSLVEAYFQAVAAEFAATGNRYRIGVYGSGTVCGHLLDLGLAEVAWLALSRCWPGTPGFFNAPSPRWNLFQFSHSARFAGRTLDANMVNPLRRDFGAFDRTGRARLLPQIDLEDFRAAVHFLKRKSTLLRSAPDPTSKPVFELNRSHNPLVLEQRGGWLGVSIDGSALIDGYVAASDLVRGAMPAC